MIIRTFAKSINLYSKTMFKFSFPKSYLEVNKYKITIPQSLNITDNVIK